MAEQFDLSKSEGLETIKKLQNDAAHVFQRRISFGTNRWYLYHKYRNRRSLL